ncbi:hypothetical protein, partial [Candidatus Enterovibrio escicola]|uniref:hypothetical protein n=1 Tax=Candidatus Enterovibrio escicola TaxID=1927127 RepID=UPI0012383437
MGNIDSLLKRKRQIEDLNTSRQSKNSSLVMASLKSSIPLILEARRTHHTEQAFMDQIASFMKDSFNEQQKLIEALKIQAGGFDETESYIWRRTFGISSNGIKSRRFPSENITLAILSERSIASKFCAKLGINSEEVSELIKGVNRYNLYKEANSFFNSPNASLMNSSSKIEREFRKINFSTSEVYARSMVAKAFTVIATELYKLCPNSLNTKQQTMFQKACIGHTSKLVSHSLLFVGAQYKWTVGEYQISEFEDSFMSELDLLKNCAKYCTNNIKETLSAFEEEHRATELKEAPIKMSVADILNAIESTQMFLPRISDGIPINIVAKQFVNTLNMADHLTKYITKNIDNYITSIGSDSSLSFAHNTIYNAIISEVKDINFSDLNIDERYLKMSANIAIYLTSEQPARNDTLNEAGLSEEAILDFRKTRNIAFAIGLSSPFQNRQVIIPTVAELTKALVCTNQFNWGINLAYIAPKIAKSILDSTNRLYLEMAQRYESTNTSLYRACIQASTQCFVDTWKKEAETTLALSKRKYGRGDITVSESNQISDKILKQFDANSYEHNATMKRLTTNLNDAITLH